VLRGLRLETNEAPGQMRTSKVGVGSYLGAPPGECEHLVRRLCEWLDSDFFRSASDNNITATAILKAILAHLYIAWIHPFPDGNGRTARLVEFQILCAAGVPSPAAHLLSNHYNKTRSEYYRQLAMSSKSGGDIIPFLQYAIQGLVDGLIDQLWIIKIYQWHIMWLNHIHGCFGHHKHMSPSELRQHHLAIDLSDSIF